MKENAEQSKPTHCTENIRKLSRISSEAYSELCQVSKMGCFVKIINGL